MKKKLKNKYYHFLFVEIDFFLIEFKFGFDDDVIFLCEGLKKWFLFLLWFEDTFYFNINLSCDLTFYKIFYFIFPFFFSSGIVEILFNDFYIDLD